MIGPLLAIFPHPDDETFTSAGVMAAAVARGVPVTVISATRGEAGESSIPGLDDPERLGVVRERELRDAMRQIGVTDVRMLGYRDSGMEGSPQAEDAQAFIRVSVAVAAAKLVPHIRTIQPQVILTLGPEGMYGHPDHLHLHHVTLRAIAAAADPKHQVRAASAPWQTPHCYFATVPREAMLELLNRPGSPLASISQTARDNLGTPQAGITYAINVEPWAQLKRNAIAAHRTQTGEGGPLAQIPPEVRERQLATEYFVRARLPWSIADPADDSAPDVIAMLAAERPAG
ncbi:MAG: PIG-L family deacetylase [Chloroflexia bacterium]|nr:PIG-L family deacetylase [Chloroflexia bacterium]